MNQAETAMLRAAFESAGYTVVPFGTVCDVCVIHGCTVTANAERDSVRLVRSAKRVNPGAFVVIAGCVAEIEGDMLRASCGADLAAGQRDKFNLPAILSRYGFCPEPVQARRLPREDALRVLPRFDTTRAFVKIQDGCDFRCAYCIVPDVRGRPKSRPFNEILKEIDGLGDLGYREVVLTGANIGCYDHNGKKLVDLLERIESFSSIERVRVSSIEISTVERAVIEFMADSKKLCRFLHLPLQSGDDAVLKKMGRHYNTRQFRELIDYAENKVGAIGFGTDALVGFPGEDTRAFTATEQLIASMPISNLHVFTYSMRKGTKACAMRPHVPHVEKKARAVRLIELGRAKRENFAKQWIGKEVSALVESIDASGCGTGWTGEYLRARITGDKLQPNQIVRFVPDKVEGDMLLGARRH